LVSLSLRARSPTSLAPTPSAEADWFRCPFAPDR
jgi:hypothetical protein